MNEEFNFELFTGKKGKYNVTVSLSKPGVLSFSSGMARKYTLSQYKGAKLYFDATKKVIAVKFLLDEEENMFSMKSRNENKGSYIACKSFFTAYEIQNYFSKRYEPMDKIVEGLGNVTLINLDSPTN